MSSPVYIVTGASRGIGRAIVDSLLNSQIKPVVIGISRTKEPLEKLASENTNFHYLLGDTSEDLINKNAVDLAVSKYGRLDGIVLNAGVLEPVARLVDASIDEWKRLYDVNIFSIISLLKHSIPHLRDGGRAVFVSSGAATGHYPTWGAYGSSKASLNHIAATLAAEEPSIFSIAIAPGVVDTQMQVNIREQRKYSASGGRALPGPVALPRGECPESTHS